MIKLLMMIVIKKADIKSASLNICLLFTPYIMVMWTESFKRCFV